MRKTRLMQVLEKSGDIGGGIVAPRTMDPVVHALAERLEPIFGPEFIVEAEPSIVRSAGGVAIGKLLEVLTAVFLEDVYVPLLKKQGIDSFAKNYPRLNQNTYVEYYILSTDLDRLLRSSKDLATFRLLNPLLVGYQTKTPHAVIGSVAEFFERTKDRTAALLLLQKLSKAAKQG